MSELVLKMSMSLDGFVARADGSNDWIGATYTDDAADWTVETLSGPHAHVVGATTYRAMADHWPHSDAPFAPPMNNLPKIVFSASDLDATWGPVRMCDGDLVDEIASLKDEHTDGYLLAHGGAKFVRSLVRARLIDEYRLLVHPVVLGSGLSIFDEALDLKHVSSTTFRGGTTAHVLRPR